MSTEQQHVNHPLTELAIRGIRFTVSTTRTVIHGFRAVNDSLADLENYIDSKYQRFKGKVRNLRKQRQFSEESKVTQVSERSGSKLSQAQSLLVKPGKEKTIGFWLLAISILIYGMICLGAYTRLLKFGHSITGMHPTGLKQHYDSFKNYFEHMWKKSHGFELLFLNEYLSTMIERTIGLLFLLPFGYFLFRGFIRQKLRNRLFGLIGMHLLQSFIGTWLLNIEARHKLGRHDRMLVSPYRMFVHWNTTMLMFGVLLWNALTLVRGPREKSLFGGFKDTLAMRKKMLINLGINAANFMTGVIVAANDGAREFNTFPDMNGRFIPEGYLQEKFLLRDLFENVATAQFHHRLFAYGTYAGAVFLFILSRKYNLSQFAKRAILVLFIVANLQLIDGFLVLMTKGYWLVGFFHQSNAIWILGASLVALHALSVPFSSSTEKGSKEEIKNIPKKMKREERSSDEPESKRLKRNIKQSVELTEQKIKEEIIPSEPVGETEKEPGDTSRVKEPETNIYSEQFQRTQIHTRWEDFGSEPVSETTK